MTALPFILITRPAEDAAETATMVQAMGMEAVIAPVMRVSDTDAPLPDPARYDALFFSSGQGVRAFLRRDPDPAWFAKPVLSIGPHTAALAKAAGWGDVTPGPDGGMGGVIDDMMRVITERTAQGQRILHGRGRDVRQGALPPPPGMDGIILYKVEATETLDPAIAGALRQAGPQGRAGACLFYSARSAAIFMDLIRQNDLTGTLKRMQALCLARSVLESLKDQDWAAIRIAPVPDASGMRSVLEEFNRALSS